MAQNKESKGYFYYPLGNTLARAKEEFSAAPVAQPVKVKETAGSKKKEPESPKLQKSKPTSKLKIAKVILSVSVWGLVCFLCVGAIVSFIRKDDQPNIFGVYTVTILSDSMQPAIKAGALIVNTRPSQATDIKVGDVITYRVTANSGQTVLVTHRVSDVIIHPDNGDILFRTKGDNNALVDNYFVPFEEVVGRHNGVTIPFLGFIVGFFTSLYGIMALAAGLVIYVFFHIQMRRWYPTKKPLPNVT